MLLLLVWRHLSLYVYEHPPFVNFKASIRITPSADAGSLRSDASRKLAPVVLRLSTMVRTFHAVIGTVLMRV